jgi:hypothetical protein
LKSFCADTSFLDTNEVMKLLDSPARASAWYLLNFALVAKQSREGVESAAAV